MNEFCKLTLNGIDGSNPLGFIAALGTWRISARLYPGIRLAWISHAGQWSPCLFHSEQITKDDIVGHLHGAITEMRNHLVLRFAQNLKLTPDEFRSLAKKAIDRFLRVEESISVEFLAAYASDATVNEQGTLQDTALRTMSGAGHQHFLKTMNDLMMITTAHHLYETLFGVWSYDEEKIGLRFDPSEDKRYALAWRNPSQDVTMTQRGANCLAVEGIPLLTSYPSGRYLETTGFVGHKRSNTFWTWPIWESPINIDVGRSLLALRALTSEEIDSKLVNAHGVVAVFRSQRITIGKFRNFTPSSQVA